MQAIGWQTVASSFSQIPGSSDSTIDTEEIARFERLSQDWWDPNGPMKALMKLNPTRIGYIRDQVLQSLDVEPFTNQPFAGLKVLDIGCGGGLLSEPIARLGGEVLGIDAAATNISVAKTHARQMGLKIDYRSTSLEDLTKSGELYDIVLAMEILEHVADRSTFIRLATKCVQPGGIIFVSTINRTIKALATAKIGAEYILNWVPKGTHDWRKFSRPSFLVENLMHNGLEIVDIRGMHYSLFSDLWHLSNDVRVNYILHAKKLLLPLNSS